MREKYYCGRKYEMRAAYTELADCKKIKDSVPEHKCFNDKKIRYERSVLGKTELKKKAETGPVQGIYILTYGQAKISSDCCR